MKNIKTIMGVLFLVALLASCHKEALPLYQQTRNNVFFNFSGGNDSVTYTFAYTPGVLIDTIYLPVSISGNRTPKGVSYKVVSDSGTTAVAGLDYAALQTSYAIPPDSGNTWMPIVLLNNDTLLTQHSVTLNLKLVETSDLGVQMPDIIRAKIIISNKLEKPAWWDRWMTYYSDEKFELFIIATNGVTQLANDDATYGLFAPQSLYYIGLMNGLINDPVGWITKNPDRGYVLQPQSDGTYYFYNSATPSSRIQVIFDPSANKYYFVQQIGGYVTPN